MKVRLGAKSIYLDEKRSGRFFFPMSVFQASIKGLSVTIRLNLGSPSVVTVDRKAVGVIRDTKLAYHGGEYNIQTSVTGSGIMPAVVNAANGELVALYVGPREVDYRVEYDPVLLSFSMLFLCLVQWKGEPQPGILVKASTGLQIRRFSPSSAMSMAILYSTIIFVLLAQRFRTGIPASILILAYGTFLSGICILLLVYHLAHRSRIYYHFH